MAVESQKIKLDPKQKTELWRQLYEALRQRIISGELSPGERLSSSRDLAEAVSVSRKTVRLAYQQLLTEGYLEARSGSGTYVHKELEGQRLTPETKKTKTIRTDKKQARTTTLSSYAKAVMSLNIPEIPAHKQGVAFFNWKPELGKIPETQWSELLMREHVRTSRKSSKETDDPQGHEGLRHVIAGLVGRTRGVKCHGGQVVIISGMQQTFDLIARIHSQPGHLIAMEDPSWPPMRYAFSVYGSQILPVPLDDQGLTIEPLLTDSTAHRIRLVSVSPSHQFPTGITMPLARRLALLDWAKYKDALILEDDWDSDFGFQVRPVPALAALDHAQSVIYHSTLSKILFAPFSIGYLIVPENLAAVYARSIWITGDLIPAEVQSILADFIEQGYLERHIKRIAAMYNKRRTLLVAALRSQLGDLVEILNEHSGLYVLVRFQTKETDEQLVRKAASIGLSLLSTRPMYLLKPQKGEFALHYAKVDEEQIEDGVRLLRRLLRGS
jgi:GntR family transcriptional regulator/MocR family aminotransferase